MLLTGLFLDDSTVPADFQGLAAVALVGLHELDAAVAMPVVVAIHKRGHPKVGELRAGKGPTRIVRSVSLSCTGIRSRGCRWTPLAWKTI